MWLLCLLLSLVTSLFANSVVTANDPSTLVNGVSVITGDLYTLDEDIVVAGVQPIRLRRSYLSSVGDWTPYAHLIAVRYIPIGVFEVREADGPTITYLLPESTTKKEDKRREHEATRCPSIIHQAPGVTNTNSGAITGQTNYENQYLMVPPSGKSFVLHAANGTKRFYSKMHRQKKQELVNGEKGYLQYFYLLHSEELPNGNKIEYRWDDHNHLTEIITRSPLGIIYASLSFPKWKDNDMPTRVQIFSSDQQVLSYESDYLDTKHKKHWALKAIEPPDEPKRHFSHDIKRIAHGVKKPYLEHITLSNGRETAVEYEEYKDIREASHYRVKKLRSPLGSDSTLHVSHTFFYFPQDRHTYVLDASGNKTSYFWNAEKRLTRIDSYEGNDRLHTSERFAWDGIKIRCKSLLDAEQNPIWARTYEYDAKGNVSVETYFGNLSGSGSPLQIDPNNCVIDNGVERSIKKMFYSNDDRNLLVRQEEPSGLTITYDYLPNSNLLKTKILSDHNSVQITTSYEYDAHHLLIRETTDDTLTRTIQQITPRYQQPYFGMPEVIEEKYENNGQEILLNKTVLQYGKAGQIVQKDIYDGTNTYRYSLHFAYDSRGRLERETNAYGWESIYRYDALGNRVYAKDFSGVETFSHYDAANRLIKKEEVGFDGLLDTTTYQYDTKHNLIAQTDVKGHTTRYTLTPFGKRAETHFPSIETSDGGLTTPTLRSSFDSAGNEILSHNAEGFATHTTYNAYGNPTHVQHPNGAQESWTYNLDGTLRCHIDAAGVLTTQTRDYLGRIIRKTISHNNTTLAEETYQYQGLYPTTKTDAEGHQTLFTYDKAGRKTSETYAHETISFHYDELSRNDFTEQGNLRIRHKFDLLGRIEETLEEDISTNELLRKTAFQYDTAGNRIAILRWIGADSQQTIEQFAFDSQKRLIAKIDPLGHQETISYNDHFTNSHLQTVLQKIHTDPMGLQTIETFDTQNQIVRLEKQKHGKTLALEEKFYNRLSKSILQINTVFTPTGISHKIRTAWEYDSAGRPITILEAEGTPDAKITTHTYTARGEKQTTTKPDGTLLTFEYTPLGHLASLTSSDHTVHHQMRYNKLGHLIWHDGNQRTVDSKGRLLSETFLDYTIQNSYNCLGQKTTCRCPQANLLINYTYRGQDMIQVTRSDCQGNALYTHRYLLHDLSGNLLISSLPHHLGSIRYHYNGNSQRQTIQSPIYQQHVLERDPSGNISHLLTQDQHSHFTYDELSQLTSESGLFQHNYTHNSLFSRLQKDDETYDINILNQITSHIDYDKNGNPLKQGDHFYTFDALDRLIQIKTPTFTQTYTYDSQHRRLSATTWIDAVPTTQYFLYDNQKEIGSFNEELQLLELRILGNTPHAEIDASIAIELQNIPYIPIHDLSGNITALLPFDSATPPQIAFYSAFGEELNPLSSPWRFSSKRVDPTGLVYYGRRYYQPDIGRWLSPDPAGFTNGINLYAFVANCPLTHFDEYGLELASFNQDWLKPEPWKNWAPTSWQQQSWQKMSTQFGTKPPPTLGPSYSAIPNTWKALSANPNAMPLYYRNGIANTAKESIEGALALQKTFEGIANVIPAYGKSYGVLGDLVSVFSSKFNPWHKTDSIERFSRNLKWDTLCLDLIQDPRKIFIVGFSRGGADIYHATKDFTPEQRNRLIIIACGPTMILPKNLGYRVTNLISQGDVYSQMCNPYSDRKSASSIFNVHYIPAKDSNGLMCDHFFQSKTYQNAILKYCADDYKIHGISK